MKKLFSSIIAIVFAMGACTCTDEPIEKRQIEQAQDFSNIPSYNIEINMGNRIKLDIDSVYAVILTPSAKNNRLVLAGSVYNDSSFTLSIPSLLDTIHLLGIYKVLLSEYDKKQDLITVSDKDAKTSLPIRFDAFKNNKFVGSFICGNKCKGICERQFRYIDKPFTIKGSYLRSPNHYYDFNIDLKEGWNHVYWHFQYGNSEINYALTNNVPADAGWYFRPKDSAELL